MFVRKVFRKISPNLDYLESDLLKDRQDKYFFDVHMLFVDLAPLQSSCPCVLSLVNDAKLSSQNQRNFVMTFLNHMDRSAAHNLFLWVGIAKTRIAGQE